MQLLPFIIFIASMKFILDIRNNKDLLTMKIFGFSNFKIFFTCFDIFFLGLDLTFFINPVTSAMSKYYEQTKASYSKDIDHLVTFNKNGLWIKESTDFGERIISASSEGENKLKDVTIYRFDKNYNLKEKIFSKSADIEKNDWFLKEVNVLKISNIGISEEISKNNFSINSIYTYEKINSLFKNFDTLSFIDLLFNYNNLVKKGYNNLFLKHSFHSMLSMPFFLFIMTALAAILILNTLKKSNNVKFIVIGIVACVIIYYLKIFLLL